MKDIQKLYEKYAIEMNNLINSEIINQIKESFPECNSLEDVKKLCEKQDREAAWAYAFIEELRNKLNSFSPLSVCNISEQKIIEAPQEKNDLVNSLTALKTSLDSLQNTITTELKQTEEKIKEQEVPEDNSVQFYVEDYKKLFCERFGLTKLNSAQVLKLANYILKLKPLILIQDDTIENQVCRYFVERCIDKQDVLEVLING